MVLSLQWPHHHKTRHTKDTLYTSILPKSLCIVVETRPCGMALPFTNWFWLASQAVQLKLIQIVSHFSFRAVSVFLPQWCHSKLTTKNKAGLTWWTLWVCVCWSIGMCTQELIYFHLWWNRGGSRPAPCLEKWNVWIYCMCTVRQCFSTNKYAMVY